MSGMNDRYLLPEMLKRVLAINPNYPGDIEMDGRPLLKVAEFIYKQMQLGRGVENNAYAILPVWEQLYTIAYNDAFYTDKSLATISNHIQEFFQKAKNGNSKLSGSKLKDKLAARLKKR
jgi:hypothetical protein